jgi:hypothetical protein
MRSLSTRTILTSLASAYLPVMLLACGSAPRAESAADRSAPSTKMAAGAGESESTRPSAAGYPSQPPVMSEAPARDDSSSSAARAPAAKAADSRADAHATTTTRPAGAAAAAPPGPPPAMPAAAAAVATPGAMFSDGDSRSGPARIAATPPSQPPLYIPTRPEPRPQAGLLTVGVWDDNRNPEAFANYLSNARVEGRETSLTEQLDFATLRTLATQGVRPHTELDIQLVIDTTGSMGDELGYLQTEFDSIAAQVRRTLPNVAPRWSLVVYRDHGDEYVTRTLPFTTDTANFRQMLSRQSANGGGDTPEAVVEGLSAGLSDNWRSTPETARIMFWVADAPTHRGEGRALSALVRKASNMGVHIYPVAASGVDDEAEYQMRSTAAATGGRYIFLTDDSGVGNSHAEPHIPCYSVTRLDSAIVRMVTNEVHGTYSAASESDVVRKVGSPQPDGKCRLKSGLLVASY